MGVLGSPGEKLEGQGGAAVQNSDIFLKNAPFWFKSKGRWKIMVTMLI
jgi:hypothetical protein